MGSLVVGLYLAIVADVLVVFLCLFVACVGCCSGCRYVWLFYGCVCVGVLVFSIVCFSCRLFLIV